jgi:predicted AlkP superfamily pyrophosphatase or phosphodiesterase
MIARRQMLRLLPLLAGLVLFVAGCGTTPRTAAAARAPLLLISLDGFRWDYLALHPDETPRLRELARTGASAKSLLPAFPSNTFGNHYTIVTGLYPAHHGIINNRFFDPALGRPFQYNVPLIARQSAWWGGEPIWNTAVRAGRVSATSFWPGSEAEIGGRRATYWRPFDLNRKFDERLEELAGWLKLPPEQRPAVITLYLEATNTVGHANGPDSPELAAAVRLLDQQVGAVIDRLRADRQEVNLLIVSDHGMTNVSPERAAILDDYVDLAKVQVDFEESVMGLRPRDSDVDGLVQALARLSSHYKVYRASDLPARYHLSGSARIPPVWIVPEEGWEIFQRSTFTAYLANFHKGQHGYDPAYPTMHGILIAAGPAFRSGGLVVDSVENIHVYNLMCAVLGLKPAKNDGDNRLVLTLLR